MGLSWQPRWRLAGTKMQAAGVGSPHRYGCGIHPQTRIVPCSLFSFPLTPRYPNFCRVESVSRSILLVSTFKTKLLQHSRAGGLAYLFGMWLLVVLVWSGPLIVLQEVYQEWNFSRWKISGHVWTPCFLPSLGVACRTYQSANRPGTTTKSRFYRLMRGIGVALSRGYLSTLVRLLTLCSVSTQWSVQLLRSTQQQQILYFTQDFNTY